MTSYESLHIFKLIKISNLYNFLTLWIFFLQFSTFLKMKQYQLCPVISMHVEKQSSSPLRYMGIIHPCFSAFFTKVDNFGIVKLASLDNVALPK